MNVINASLSNIKIVTLSTDKASNNKFIWCYKISYDKLFISANSTNQKNNPIFSIVRYGNVMGSRGSVIIILRARTKRIYNY